jgi:integrase
MPRPPKPLTDVEVRRLKPGPKPYRRYDGHGLFLEIRPNGSRLWRLKVRVGGRERRFALGAWPWVGLAQARRERDRIRSLVAQGVDPLAERRQARARATTFRELAERWEREYLAAKAPSHRAKLRLRMRKWILPTLGERAVSSITSSDVLALMRRAVAAGQAATAARIRQLVGQILRWGASVGYPTTDVTWALRRVLPGAPVRHFPAPVDDPALVGECLRALDRYAGDPVVRAAALVQAYTFVRTCEVRTARWSDIDFGENEWRFVSSKTKTPTVCPLSPQVLAILRELEPVTRHFGWVFPSPRDPNKPLSESAIANVYRRLGLNGAIVGHGWRALARTWAREKLGVPVEVIELQLAHRVADPLGRAYNRAEFREARHELMRRWASLLDRLKTGEMAQVVQLRRGGTE